MELLPVIQRRGLAVILSLVVLGIAACGVLETGAEACVWTGSFLQKFGGESTGDGHLETPGGVAVDSSGNVWVADTAHNRIQEFSAEGAFIRQFGARGEGNGQFIEPNGIAVDSSGNVWVADTNNNRIQKFNSKGEYLSQFGTFGEGNGQLKQPFDVAVDPSGNVWVADTNNNRIQEFSSAGVYVRKVGALRAAPAMASSGTRKALLLTQKETWWSPTPATSASRNSTPRANS